MRKTSLVFLILFGNAFNTQAQIKNKCGSYEHYQYLLKSDPHFARNQKEIEVFTENFIRNGRSRFADNIAGKGTPVYTIPLVVHVVYKSAQQNISDAQVKSQITVLNQDYQLKNPDTPLVPTVFKSAIADFKIKNKGSLWNKRILFCSLI